MEVKIVSSDAELRRISPVLLQLRSQYDEDSLLAQIRLQRADGYQLAYVEKDGEVLCVAEFIVCNKLAWQKHIYVDDLVTDAAVRFTGAGKFIMDWLKKSRQRTWLPTTAPGFRGTALRRTQVLPAGGI